MLKPLSYAAYTGTNNVGILSMLQFDLMQRKTDVSFVNVSIDQAALSSAV